MVQASSLAHQPASFLLESVCVLEQNLIAGIAEPSEIDAYVEIQLELSARGRLELILDSRD